MLCTDIFDEFMESNRLYPIALSDAPDEEILRHFLEGKLPRRIKDDLLALFEVVDTPIAVRSSSLLEDSHYQPFAGIYSTYMVPKSSDPQRMLKMVTDAIKGCLCLGVLRRLQGLHDSHLQHHRPRKRWP